ncbi:hypothetical protein KY285_024272 [Solanum tuberosum]|nr:hypothetical protein KY285_024272 [Solanum tuberosum]
MLCSNSPLRLAKTNYYVCNPTTKHYTALPKSVLETENSKIHGISLAFDPAKSPHYKVICVRDSVSSPQHYQIEIYSAQTGPWRLSGDPFIADVNFSKGMIKEQLFSTIRFDVYEMRRDDSEWFVKYKVDFERPDHELTYCSFTILSLVRGKREEDAFLVLAAVNDDKVMKYNLINKTFEKFCDYDVDDERVFNCSTIGAFEYIESLCCV